MKKTYIILLAALAATVWMPASAQDRFDNFQWSLHYGMPDFPEVTLLDQTDKPITLTDQNTAFPWHASLRFEREKIASDLLGYGFSLSVGVRHSGWNFTIPKGTANVDNTYLGPTDQDCEMYLSMLGFTLDGGAYAALHLTNWMEFDLSAGLAVSRWWEGMGSKCTYGGYEDESGGGSVEHTPAGTVFGPYAQGALKFTFNEDYFFSLSARYTMNVTSSKAIEGSIDWDGPFYSCNLNAPMNGELLIMAGIGIMIETE